MLERIAIWVACAWLGGSLSHFANLGLHDSGFWFIYLPTALLFSAAAVFGRSELWIELQKLAAHIMKDERITAGEVLVRFMILRDAAVTLINGVRRRHPVEDLRCEDMRQLAISAGIEI